jgi:(R,R)-butanediol dehydrogenase/meso-butanediol dehydrogenase/diacetyl reductase
LDPQRDNLAVEVSARTDGLGPQVVYICTGAPAAFGDAVSMVRRGGQIFVLGLCPEPVPADLMTVVLSELDIRGSYLGHGAFPAALDYLAQGRIRVEPLISHEIALDDVVDKGFEEMLRPETTAIKVLVRMRREP